MGIISIAIVLLGWISLYQDFESEDQDFYFLLFQGYIGLTIFEAVVKVSQNYAQELDRLFFQTIIRIGFWATILRKILPRRCGCLIFVFVAGFFTELVTDSIIGHTGYKYAFGA